MVTRVHGFSLDNEVRTTLQIQLDGFFTCLKSGLDYLNRLIESESEEATTDLQGNNPKSYLHSDIRLNTL
jgi:hypothetical protein